MTARCKKRRNQNNAIRRAKNKVKEVKKLKKMLGFIEEDVGEGNLMDKLKDITEQKKKEEELELLKKETLAEIVQKEQKATAKREKFITVVNPKTNVKHLYNVKTKRDQFGQYPAWYNPRKERKKQMVREGKDARRKEFRGKRMHFIDRTNNWKALLAQ
ncbi:protein LLP homolog [Anopheles arabiensis]|uniref:AGAP005685-PA n=3 Tax=gambiae species complex TaxID=44542 RepID=Q7PNZ0_ANOGA|nr:protein LLP homolog [Anopheles arabiensis]XP_315699.3 protein LLP homolog [Anopheles gambiae]EAA11316.4 AGAP005685-PA [Anopheles gambiae str. PEST]